MPNIPGALYSQLVEAASALGYGEKELREVLTARGHSIESPADAQTYMSQGPLSWDPGGNESIREPHPIERLPRIDPESQTPLGYITKAEGALRETLGGPLENVEAPIHGVQQAMAAFHSLPSRSIGPAIRPRPASAESLSGYYLMIGKSAKHPISSLEEADKLKRKFYREAKKQLGERAVFGTPMDQRPRIVNDAGEVVASEHFRPGVGSEWVSTPMEKSWFGIAYEPVPGADGVYRLKPGYSYFQEFGKTRKLK